MSQIFQGSRWRHKKRGTVHTVLDHAKLQTDKPLEDNAVLIVYRSEDGALWVRPDEEFADGRFELMRPEDLP